MARYLGSCHVSPAFGEFDSLRLSERRFPRFSLSSSLISDPAGSRGLKFRGQSHRRLSFFRPIMATDESISSWSSDCAGNIHLIPTCFICDFAFGFPMI